MNHVIAAETLEATATNRTTKSVTRYLPTVVRVAFGLLLFVAGLNFFLNFIPQPTTPMPEGVVALTGGFIKSGYMFPLIGATHAVVGALLLTNRFVPLALALIAPVIVNIVALHSFLDHSGIPMALIVLASEIYLAWTHRNAYRPMLAARAPLESK